MVNIKEAMKGAAGNLVAQAATNAIDLANQVAQTVLTDLTKMAHESISLQDLFSKLKRYSDVLGDQDADAPSSS